MIYTANMSRAGVGTIVELHTIVCGHPIDASDLMDYAKIISGFNKRDARRAA